jgi:hypothetical protein
MEWSADEEVLEEGELRSEPEKQKRSQSMSQRSVGDGVQGGDGSQNSNAFYVDLPEFGSRISSDLLWNPEAEAKRKEDTLKLVNILDLQRTNADVTKEIAGDVLKNLEVTKNNAAVTAQVVDIAKSIEGAV